MANGGVDVAEVATALARSLRGAGLDVTASATIDFAEALTHVGMASPETVFFAGRTCFCRRAEDADTYAVTFWAFFHQLRQSFPGGRLTTVPPVPVARPSAGFEDELNRSDDSGSPAADAGTETVSRAVAYSAVEVLRTKDFAACTDDELAEVERLISRIRQRSPQRRGRRLDAARFNGRGALDVRRTVREALAHGGDPVRLARRARQQRPRRVVLLLDVSGSMRPYARAMLRFAHASVASHRSVEAFTLGTRCTRVTRQLAWRDPDAALLRAATAAEDLDGGTRLGECLSDFVATYGVGGLARGATVMLCSDGWDRGDPAVLEAAMARLALIAHKVIWVNPLKASPGYEPLTRGIIAALPYTDEFVSGHSLDALDELAELLTQ
jgi:uncharacterized protein with von Willebrand factor type A (vWA) domain